MAPPGGQRTLAGLPLPLRGQASVRSGVSPGSHCPSVCSAALEGAGAVALVCLRQGSAQVTQWAPR